MIGGVIRYKAIARTMVYQQSHIEKEIGVGAGPGTLKNIFKQISACHIRYGRGNNKKEDPPKALLFKIERNKKAKKQVYRRPVQAITCKRHYYIKKRVDKVIIHFDE